MPIPSSWFPTETAVRCRRPVLAGLARRVGSWICRCSLGAVIGPSPRWGPSLSRLLARSLDPGWRRGDVLSLWVVSPLRARVIEAAERREYDSGTPPPQVYPGVTFPKEAWKSMFPKRMRLELDRRSLQSLRLRETSDGNRLTVDADPLRIDIAQSASEIEREWLHQFLAKRYSLPLTQRR